MPLISAPNALSHGLQPTQHQRSDTHHISGSGQGPSVTSHLAVGGALGQGNWTNKSPLSSALQALKLDPGCSPALLGTVWVQMDISSGSPGESVDSMCHGRPFRGRTGPEVARQVWCLVNCREYRCLFKPEAMAAELTEAVCLLVTDSRYVASGGPELTM